MILKFSLWRADLFGAMISACVLIAGPASAANYFNWGVEDLRPSFGVNGADPYDVQFHGASTRDCAEAHRGSCSMKLQVIGNDAGNQGLGADIVATPADYPWNIVASPALYYRWWMKIMPGFSWGNGTAKTKSSRVASGAQGYTGYLMDYGFLIGECSSFSPPECTLNTGGSNGADSGLYIPFNFRNQADGLWHEYIVKIKPNTSGSCVAPVNCDARFQAWVDGVSVGEYNDFKLHNGADDPYFDAWGGWMVYPYFQLNGTSADGGTIYLDDFSTDDVWNSLLSGPGAKPAAPRGLKMKN